MYDPQSDIRRLMELYKQEIKSVPGLPDKEVRHLRARLVLEEALEFVKAMGFEIVPFDAFPAGISDITLQECGEPDLVEAADAIGDILVVAYGAANSLGVSAQDIFAEVHRSNLTKIHSDGTVHKDEFGKVIKPDHYSKANIKGLLGL